MVDGGVADNQGLEALVGLDSPDDCDEVSTATTDDLDVLLVSDASGQMEMHTK